MKRIALATSAFTAFEREIGKLVACEDALALIMAQRTNRVTRFDCAGPRDGGTFAYLTKSSFHCSRAL